jgi:hypothetical protein
VFNVLVEPFGPSWYAVRSVKVAGFGKRSPRPDLFSSFSQPFPENIKQFSIMLFNIFKRNFFSNNVSGNVVLLCSGGRVKNIVFTSGATEKITSDYNVFALQTPAQ